MLGFRSEIYDWGDHWFDKYIYSFFMSYIKLKNIYNGCLSKLIEGPLRRWKKFINFISSNADLSLILRENLYIYYERVAQLMIIRGEN